MGRHDRHESRTLHRKREQSPQTLRALKERARKELTIRDNYQHHHSSRDYQHRNRSDGDLDRTKRKDNERNRNVIRSRSRSSSPRHNPKRFNNPENRRHKYEKSDNQSYSHGKKQSESGDNKPEEKLPEIKPNFELTGNLAKDTNLFNGVVVKYNEPPEAKKTRKHWRLYPFKGDKPLDFIPVHRQSAYLFGRERKLADIPIDHPSCSKQHAVLQYRSIEIEKEDGTKVRATRPYLIDLESANGTYVNNKPIEPKRFVELLERDVIKFGFSTREYVLLHEQSQKDSDNDED